MQGWDTWLAQEFVARNQDLRFVAEGFVIRFQSERGHLQMLLEVTPTTRKEDVRAGWSLIEQWQERLRRWQDSVRQSEGAIVDPKTARTERKAWLLEEMHKMNQAGRSPRQIADHLNGYLEHELRGYLANVAQHGAEAADFKTPLDVIRWHQLTGEWWTGWHYARWLLGDLGMPPEDIESWCTAGLDNLRDGKPAYLPDGAPITTDRVREQLRYYFKRRGGKKQLT
jgi:hypothetical protein